MSRVDRACIVALNLSGLWRALRAYLQGRPIYVIEIGIGFPMLRGVWRRLYNFMCRRGAVLPIEDLFPSDQRYFVHSWMPEYPDLFRKLEDGIAGDYRFDRLEQLPDYALAIKHAACQYTQKLWIVTTLKRLSDTGDQVAEVSGIDRDIPLWYRRYYGAEPTFPVKTIKSGGVFSAAMTAVSLVVYSWLWILRRIKRVALDAKTVHLGADFVLDQRTTYLVSEITDSKDEVLFVFRNHQQRREAASWDEFTGFQGIHPDELHLTVGDGVATALLVLKDIFRLFWYCHQLPADLFFAVVKLPFNRILFRTLFQRHPVNYFLSRDDYNSEHIIRTDELRRSGATSLGLAHGLPIPGIIDTRTRYVDFDTYFVFGDYPYDQHYREKWPAKMQYRAVGSFGMTREQLGRLSEPRSRDIIFFISRLLGERELFGEAVKLARAFPDRKIIIKEKYSARSEYHLNLTSIIDNPPENIKFYSGNSYPLMLECRYAVSNDTSSVAAEAIQYGLITYVWDTYPPDLPSYYREFPELCVRRAEEVIEKIRAIESGEAEYPRERFDKLIDLSGKVIYDVIRDELKNKATQSEATTGAA
ncbi:MAG: hypothetical protein HQ503_18965 [Rhodospirillales bacterium]|nr:hypothetical protein [Rhodospirillales bacterium]